MFYPNTIDFIFTFSAWLDDAALREWPAARDAHAASDVERFLVAFGEQRGDNVDATRLAQRIAAHVRPTPLDRLGGEPVSRALRYVFAALVARLGLAPLALAAARGVAAARRSDDDDDDNDDKSPSESDAPLPAELVALWRRAAALRSWIVREQQMLQVRVKKFNEILCETMHV